MITIQLKNINKIYYKISCALADNKNLGDVITVSNITLDLSNEERFETNTLKI